MEFLAGLAIVALIAYIGYRIVKKKKVSHYVPSVPTTPPHDKNTDPLILPGDPQ